MKLIVCNAFEEVIFIWKTKNKWIRDYLSSITHLTNNNDLKLTLIYPMSNNEWLHS